MAVYLEFEEPIKVLEEELEKAKGIIKINDAISETLFISQRSVYRDCSK